MLFFITISVVFLVIKTPRTLLVKNSFFHCDFVKVVRDLNLDWNC